MDLKINTVELSGTYLYPPDVLRVVFRYRDTMTGAFTYNLSMN